jgi:quinol monooxygenase YgiN
MLKHIALIKFKPAAGVVQIRQVFQDIGLLQKAIPGIVDYSWGTNNSPEELNQDFEYGFVMTFKDAAARDAYLTHPAHEKVKQFALPLVEEIIIFDYDT